MNTTHTPSPWIVSHDPDGTSDDYCIGVPDGKVDQIAVCSMRDAALIAAAPDMYKALALMVQYDETPNGDGVLMMMRYADAIAAARAALAKARGQ